MAAPIDLRNDFDSVSLRRLAKRTRDATQSRRLLALAEVYDGGSRTDASRSAASVPDHDWVLRFNARGPDGLSMGSHRGSKLNADHRRALAVVEAGPVRSTASCAGGARTWRALGDVRHLARRDHGRARVEGARLRQDLGAAAPLSWPSAFKKNFPAELAKRARLPKVFFKSVEIELWWQDEARMPNKSHADGPDVARARGRPATNQPRSVPRRGGAGPCPGATPTPWRRTSSRVPPSIPAPMRC